MALSVDGTQAPLTVIIPASNEEALIGLCLGAVLASDWSRSQAVECIVIANGCRDGTANVARGFAQGFEDRGWRLLVLERTEGAKIPALNQGDATATGESRIYLDADVTVSPALMQQVAEALDHDAPRYASGAVQIVAKGFVSRAYARFWRKVPFMTFGVPGCGLFAVNEKGRERWGPFPDIISDDTFVRLSFRPEERIGVAAPFYWPIAEGFGRLVRVRRRQDAGVDEVAEKFPGLLRNEDKPEFTSKQKLGIALRDPLAFLVYSCVALAVRLSKRDNQSWSRGR